MGMFCVIAQLGQKTTFCFQCSNKINQSRKYKLYRKADSIILTSTIFKKKLSWF